MDPLSTGIPDPTDDLDQHLADCSTCATGNPCDEAEEILGEIVEPGDLVVVGWPFEPVGDVLGGEGG